MTKTLNQWRRGRHSCLPRCCIAYFMFRIRFAPRWWKTLVVEFHTYMDYRWGERPVEHQYVRCPVCIVRRRWASQHMCTSACSGQPGASPHV